VQLVPIVSPVMACHALSYFIVSCVFVTLKVMFCNDTLTISGLISGSVEWDDVTYSCEVFVVVNKKKRRCLYKPCPQERH
jgi:hypothetical protein